MLKGWQWLVCGGLLWMGVSTCQAQVIEITGSTTVKTFMEVAAKAYGESHPSVVIRVAGGGSGVGASSVIDGRAMLGMMSRDLSAVEKSRMQGVRQVRIGYDAIAILVSSAVYHEGHLHRITLADVGRIYRGEVTNWQQVGGDDRDILVIDKEMQRGTRQEFAKHVLGSAYAKAKGAQVVVGSNRDVSTLLMASDQAIGFLTFGAVIDDHLYPLELTVKGEAITPDATAIRQGRYPLSRSLYVLLKEDAPSYAKDFVAFLLSMDGQKILQSMGYIPLK